MFELKIPTDAKPGEEAKGCFGRGVVRCPIYLDGKGFMIGMPHAMIHQ